MVMNEPNLEIFDGNEPPFTRRIREVLGLSHNWELSGIVTSDIRKPRRDDGLDSPVPVVVNGRAVDRSIMGVILIKIKAKDALARICPCCKGPSRPHEWVLRTYKHLDFMGLSCYLEVELPKVKCDSCGTVRQAPFPLARPNVSFTKPFEEEVIRMLLEVDQKSTAEKLGTTRPVVQGIVKDRVEPELDRVDASNMSTMYVDEIQFGHGHDYVTVFSDDDHRVIHITKGKDRETIGDFARFLTTHGGSVEAIDTISADMSSAFESGVKEHFPEATLVWDRFHVQKALNQDTNTVRRNTTIGKDGTKVGNVRFTVLFRKVNLPEHHKERMEKIRLHNPRLAQAYDMKEAFCEVYEAASKEAASETFDQWVDWVKRAGSTTFKRRAYVFEEKKDNILSWYDKKVTNAVAEGINSVLKKVRSQGCGYQNLTNYKCMCFLRIGRITVSI